MTTGQKIYTLYLTTSITFYKESSSNFLSVFHRESGQSFPLCPFHKNKNTRRLPVRETFGTRQTQYIYPPLHSFGAENTQMPADRHKHNHRHSGSSAQGSGCPRRESYLPVYTHKPAYYLSHCISHMSYYVSPQTINRSPRLL